MEGTAGSRLSYSDLAPPAEMTADARRVGSRLTLPDADRTRLAKAAVRPAPSLLYADYPREVRKHPIEISDAATRLAAALHLHLD